MPNSNRESGYYWVKIVRDTKAAWIIAEYSTESKFWTITGSDYAFLDGEFLEIYESKLLDPADRLQSVMEARKNV